MQKYWVIYLKNDVGEYTNFILHEDKDMAMLHYDTIKMYGAANVKNIGRSIKPLTMKKIKELFPADVKLTINPEFWNIN